MDTFVILEKIEAAIGDVEFSIKGNSIVVGRTMTDEQIDLALAGLASMVGNIFHGDNKTVIELI